MDNFSYKNTSNTNIDMKLYYCGTEACKPGHSWGPALKDHYKIHFIHSGKGIFQVNNKVYHLSQGQGFLICPNNISFYRADEEDPWSYSWVAFNGLNAELYLNRSNLSVDNPILRCDSDVKILKCFEEMFECSKFKETEDIKLLSLLYQLIALIIDANKLDISNGHSVKIKDIYIKRSIEFIGNNYSRKISISEIAEYVGISRKYLSKLFVESLNLSLQDFLIQYRLNKAVELLKISNLSVSEISMSVGYNDMFQFSKIFKKFKGMSPSTFRNYSEYNNSLD